MISLTTIKLRPAVIHGLLAGALLFLVKIVFFASGHWQLRFTPYYPMLSFLPIYAAMMFGGRAERQLFGKDFKYWRALKSAMLTILIIVSISGLAEFIIYTTSDEVLQSSIEILRKQMIEGFRYIGKMYSTKQKDEMIQAINPSSFSYLIPQMFGFFVSNGFTALLIARFTMFKADKNDWLKSENQE
jgi:hypothetical protein